MENLNLKVNPLLWPGLFAFFLAAMTAALFLMTTAHSLLILIIALAAAAVVTATVAGVFYFSQNNVSMTEREIRKTGFSSKTIAYREIRRIQAGPGGLSIYDGGSSPIHITTFYCNFEQARARLLRLLRNQSDLQIEGAPFFIRKYLGTRALRSHRDDWTE